MWVTGWLLDAHPGTVSVRNITHRNYLELRARTCFFEWYDILSAYDVHLVRLATARTARLRLSMRQLHVLSSHSILNAHRIMEISKSTTFMSCQKKKKKILTSKAKDVKYCAVDELEGKNDEKESPLEPATLIWPRDGVDPAAQYNTRMIAASTLRSRQHSTTHGWLRPAPWDQGSTVQHTDDCGHHLEIKAAQHNTRMIAASSLRSRQHSTTHGWLRPAPWDQGHYMTAPIAPAHTRHTVSRHSYRWLKGWMSTGGVRTAWRWACCRKTLSRPSSCANFACTATCVINKCSTQY